MIHDETICTDCHYTKINNYSLRLRHCEKCDNYGEKILKANVRVIQKPVEIRIDCPHCCYEIDVSVKFLVPLTISKIAIKYPSKAKICFTRINLFLIFNFHIFRNLIRPRHKVL